MQFAGRAGRENFPLIGQPKTIAVIAAREQPVLELEQTVYGTNWMPW